LPATFRYLIDEPPVTRTVPTGPDNLDELRGETLHPTVDRDVIDGDTALGQQFLDIALGQAVPQVPADRDRDGCRGSPASSSKLPGRAAMLPVTGGSSMRRT
jgi:hypothetical protein